MGHAARVPSRNWGLYHSTAYELLYPIPPPKIHNCHWKWRDGTI